MKFTVDKSRCIGAGQCALTAPEIFDQDDEGTVLVLQEDPPPAAEAALLQARSFCPASVIEVVGEDGARGRA